MLRQVVRHTQSTKQTEHLRADPLLTAGTLWLSKDETEGTVSQGLGGAYDLPVFYGHKIVWEPLKEAVLDGQHR